MEADVIISVLYLAKISLSKSFILCSSFSIIALFLICLLLSTVKFNSFKSSWVKFFKFEINKFSSLGSWALKFCKIVSISFFVWALFILLLYSETSAVSAPCTLKLYFWISSKAFFFPASISDSLSPLI